MAKDKKNKKSSRTTLIGGQAVIEGVMMRGAASMALAVRGPKGNILLETERLSTKKSFWKRCPILRGAVNFVTTMISGVGLITKSAEMAGEEDEKVGGFGMFIAVAVGILLALGLFIALPSFLSDLIFKDWLKLSNILYSSLFEGLLRILIFISYLAIVALMKDIKRTYMYHGAEHRTISCFEHKLDMTVENVQKCSTRHDRCGTSFLFFVMVVSILVFALANWLLSLIGVPDNRFLRMAIKIALMPLVAGLSYELLRGLARANDNIFIKILKAPGLALQKLTTKIPTDDMAEVALTAFNAVYHMDAEPGIPAVKMGGRALLLTIRDVETVLKRAGIDDKAETEWLICTALGKNRSGLYDNDTVSQADYDRVMEFAAKRAQGVPLDRIMQSAEFFGRKFALNEETLCPRQETELVCERAISLIAEAGLKSAFEPCTGSGIIGITLAAKTDIKVLSSDISEGAVRAAALNAEGLDNITFKVGDMFECAEGKYDLFICNPPYIRSADIEKLSAEVREHDPRIALDGGEDGLSFYRRIADGAPAILNDGGYIVLEIGFDQGEAVRELLAADFADIEIYKDYSGNDRLVTAKKGR